MSLTGALGIDIAWRQALPAEVSFSQPRTVPVEQLFVGLDWRLAAERASSLFAICGRAHAVAMVLACEAAQDRPVLQETRLARQILAAAEALTEHGMRILVDWPRFVGQEAEVQAMRLIAEASRWLAQSAGPSAVFDGVPALPAFKAEAAALGRLAGSAMLARGGELAERIAERLGDSVSTLEDGAEEIEDSTVLGRRARDPRLDGAGLLRRVRARLLEVRLLCDWLSAPAVETAPLAQTMARVAKDSGQSVVEVARGRLTHRVRLEGRGIAALTISAPTSANFAAGGVAERVIRSIPATAREAFEWQARLAIMEIDPCVAHDIRIV